MMYFQKIGRYPMAIGLVLAMLSVIMLPEVTLAKSGGRDSGKREIRKSRSDDRRSSHREFRDSRYRHDRSYPVRGQYVKVLPPRHKVVTHGRSRFFFSGGVWYRPHGASFAIVAPPIGLFIPFLPPFYSTIWVGGVPYYYANEIYYAHRGDGYVVVEPPSQEPSQTPPPADQMFIYPRLGQTEAQQADDRYACHSWAASQTNFDPTQPSAADSGTRKIGHADYQRAMAACLDGRGYTVK